MEGCAIMSTGLNSICRLLGQQGPAEDCLWAAGCCVGHCSCCQDLCHSAILPACLCCRTQCWSPGLAEAGWLLLLGSSCRCLHPCGTLFLYSPLCLPSSLQLTFGEGFKVGKHLLLHSSSLHPPPGPPLPPCPLPHLACTYMHTTGLYTFTWIQEET